jgi:tetratricopeptide (TPR) repeat protein
LTLTLLVSLIVVICPVYSQQSSSVDQQIAKGQAAFDKHDYKTAISLWEQALAQLRRADVKRRAGDLAFNIGVANYYFGDSAKALVAFKEALAVARKSKNRPNEANALAKIGVVERNLGRYDDALRSLRQALKIHRAINSRLAEADDLNSIGNIEDRLGRYGDALASFRQALLIHREVKNRLGEADVLGNIGNVEEELARYDDSLRSQRQALKIHREIKNRLGVGNDLGNIGIVELDLGRYDDALRSNRQALAIHREMKNRPQEAIQLGNIGNVEEGLGRYDDALRVYQEARAIFGATMNPQGEADVLANIGNVEVDLGRYDDALSAYEQALVIHRKIKSRLGEAAGLGNIGNVEYRVGRYAEALRSLKQALTINQELKDRLGEANNRTAIGTVEEDLGRYDDALRSLQQALKIHRQIKSRPGEAEDLDNIGIVEEDLKRYDEALGSYQRALAIDREIKDPRGEANALGNIGNVEILLSRYEDALRFAHDGVALDRQLPNPEGLWRALRIVASAEAHLNRHDAAVADYDAALDQIEKLRAGLAQTKRSSFFSNKLFAYDEYIAYLQKLNRRFPSEGYDRKALEVLERKEARAVLEEIAGSAARRFRGVPPEVIAQDKATQAAVEAARQRLAKFYGAAPAVAAARAALNTATAHRAAFEKALRPQYPAYYALLYPKPITLRELQNVLGADEALLAYDAVAGESVLFVVTRDGLAMVPLQGSAVLAKAVERVHEHIDDMLAHTSVPKLERDAAADLPRFAADSYALYRQLIPAAAAPLIAKKHLIIIPSGPLYNVSWEALVTKGPATASRYLLEDHAISYTPSGSLLALVRKTEHSDRQRAPLLAFANPAFGDAAAGGTPSGSYAALLYKALRTASGGPFDDLKGAADEARGVRDALHAPADSVITGEEATKARLFALNASHQLATYRYLLFATHAVLTHEVKGVDQPALVLAHPDRDGFVTMADVFGLSLDADFVALSACNTARGTGNPGEGISGLTRAFLYAGTPAISVTLWEVVDEAAPQISPPFFAAMSAGVSPAEALRQAKLKMLKSSQARFRHPYAWAPSVIFGDGR